MKQSDNEDDCAFNQHSHVFSFPVVGLAPLDERVLGRGWGVGGVE